MIVIKVAVDLILAYAGIEAVCWPVNCWMRAKHREAVPEPPSPPQGFTIVRMPYDFERGY